MGQDLLGDQQGGGAGYVQGEVPLLCAQWSGGEDGQAAGREVS